MAKNYGNDVVGTFRVPATFLAGAAAWLISQGIQPTSRNDIIASALKVLAEQLPEADRPGTPERAFQLLDREWPVRSYKGHKRVPSVKIEVAQKSATPKENYAAYYLLMTELGQTPLDEHQWRKAVEEGKL